MSLPVPRPSQRQTAAPTQATAEPAPRLQTAREEQANALSHGIGFVAAAAAWPMLSDVAALHGGPMASWGIAVFAITMMLVYAASMVYHALPAGRAKRWAHRCDHAAIFLFIAGSYTPFALGPLHDTVGLPLLVGVWTVALLGMAGKALGRLRNPLLSTALYAALGWAALLVLDPLAARVGTDALLLLLAGGAAYSVGVLFFLFDHRLRFGHLIWHVFVLAGSACHVAAAMAPPIS
jgi:hemolysin III